MSKQITDRLIMVRPASFGYNEETADNNVFQNIPKLNQKELQDIVLEEFDRFVRKLRNHRVHVDVLEDIDPPRTPDAIFPNNWFSTHQNGALITYPMQAAVRRFERHPLHIHWLKKNYQVTQHIHFETFEVANLFLEGTGSIIFDREHQIAYACRSIRTNEDLFNKICDYIDYQPVLFDSYIDGIQVYHTNVIMALAETFVVICLEAIPEGTEKENLLKVFENTNKEIVNISVEQVYQFAGNMLQVKNAMDTRYTIMSENAFLSLNSDQISIILQDSYIIHAPIPNIERVGGGSVRCMMAENFLCRQKKS